MTERQFIIIQKESVKMDKNNQQNQNKQNNNPQNKNNQNKAENKKKNNENFWKNGAVLQPRILCLDIID